MIELDVRAGAKAQRARHLAIELRAKLHALGEHARAVVEPHAFERVVDAERERRSQVAAWHRVIPPHVGAMKLRAEDGVVVGLRRLAFEVRHRVALVELVERTKHKRADRVARRDAIREARLVVPVRELRVRREERDEERGITESSRDERAAFSVRERRLAERARVEEARLHLAADARRRSARLARDDAARIAPVLRGKPARIEVDAIDERRVDDARPEREVKQQGNGNVVDEVAGVPRRRAAHEEVRHAAEDGRHARHHVDRAEGISERTG